MSVVLPASAYACGGEIRACPLLDVARCVCATARELVDDSLVVSVSTGGSWEGAFVTASRLAREVR